VITGASAGVGRALARTYARRGDGVGLLARGQAGLEETAAEVSRLGGQPLPIRTDVSDAEQVEDAAARVEQDLGPIDVWINNAMVTVMAPTWDVTPEEYRRVTDVNYLGVVYGTQAALRRMRPRDDGAILQVGSALAFRGIPGQGPYCATKHAMQGFTESLHAELLHEGSSVHVGMVHLPAVNTPQFTWSRNRLPNAPQPVPPIYQPEVAADAIAWAIDHRRWETYVGVSTFATIWANRLFGAGVSRYLGKTGLDDQQTSDPAHRWPDDNLDAPVDDDQDHGAHGPFDDDATDREVFSSLTRHPAKVAAGIAALAGVAAISLARGR
jgi:NAD(P)-dependent dehydrogenase (short-subunit alcohol dehydrogenase family)